MTREPTESDYHAAIDDLVQVYHDLCPNVESFNAIYKELYDLGMEGKPLKAILCHVITRLHAGVAHGIWDDYSGAAK